MGFRAATVRTLVVLALTVFFRALGRVEVLLLEPVRLFRVVVLVARAVGLAVLADVVLTPRGDRFDASIAA